MQKAKTDEDTVRIPHTIKFKGPLFGVELEIESGGLYSGYFDEDEEEAQYPYLPQGWRQEEEHSIDGPELVSDQPYDFDTTVENLHRVFEDIKRQGHTPVRTCRGSTHIHMNCQDLTWGQLRKTVVACAWAEQFMIEYAGKGRKGNLFAMSYRHAPLGWADIISSIRERQLRLWRDTHYMAVNFWPLSTFGTIEFRMPPSSRNAEDAIEWLGYVRDIAVAGRCEGQWLWSWGENSYPLWLDPIISKIPPGRRAGLIERARAQAEHIEELLAFDTKPVPFPDMPAPVAAPSPFHAISNPALEQHINMMDDIMEAEPTPLQPSPQPLTATQIMYMDLETAGNQFAVSSPVYNEWDEIFPPHTTTPTQF